MNDLFSSAGVPIDAAAGGYPDRPGYKERETSKAAAESVEETAPLLRAKVLDQLRKRPEGMTPDEVAAELDLSVLSVRPRFTELRTKKQIIDTGERRANASGRSAKVWRAA